MDKAVPFVDFFPDIYPERRAVNPALEPNLVGVMIKSVFFHRREEALLCRGLVVAQARDTGVYTTVHFRVTGVASVVGYDLELIRDQDGEEESWELVCATWSKHFVAEPVRVKVVHDDIKREVDARVFPLKSISLAKKYVETVRGALTFGDFCPDKGYYLARDGNTPALCSDVMFGRTYYVPADKLKAGALSVSELVYDHARSEAEAKLFDGKHAPYFYRAACLDIETVFDRSYRDASLRCESFAYKFPYCTERTVSDMTDFRSRLVAALNAGRERLPKQSRHVSIPALAPDMPGQQHEITCVSLVVLNSHKPKTSPEHHRKKLIVLYNKDKVARGDKMPTADPELARGAGVDDVARIAFHPCPGELALLERTIRLLHVYGVELLYVFNAEFDVRVLEQRVRFYAESKYAKRFDATRDRCSSLLRDWRGLFMTRDLADDAEPFLQFENVRYLDMYREMLQSLGPLLLTDTLTEGKLWLAYRHIDKFNKDKAKLGHFKMNSCGMNVVDLYRMAGTRDIKFACTSMKLNDVAPFVVAKARKLHGKPPKDTRKLCKLADVSYCKMDEMIAAGGKALFAVLLYNLVDSQLCARLARVLNPVSSLFHRCRATLNIDVVVHGRGDNFGGFVQSIHSVQIPQLKFKLDTLRAQAGPAGAELSSRLRCKPELDSDNGDQWKGGAVCDPLTGLHYSGPGMGLELSFDFSSMYPSIMCALNISPETTVPWPPRLFPHDLAGWVCYSWEEEGFEYASLVLKYDRDRECFVRAPAVFSSSVEYYLNRRAEFKRKLKCPDVGEAERDYCKTQEGECKVIANSFYGTAPHPCGPLVSGHGRRQISVVNSCVSTFYQHRCPVVYGDTDSVMVSAGYGPGDPPESDVPEVEVLPAEDPSAPPGESETEPLERFARQARAALCDKFKRAGERVPAFLDYVHVALVEDTLKRMYVIGENNSHRKVVRDPRGAFTQEGYPVYVAGVPGREDADVTGPFVKDRRVKLEYENSCSVYCHVAKKSYVALTHSIDDASGDISSISVKVRGLSAFKSMRSPCDSAVTDTFIACVIRGDCVKLETDNVSCFSTCPWNQLKRGDVILYPEREPVVDELGRWSDLRLAGSFLVAHEVRGVTELRLDSGFSAVSARLASARGAHLAVRTLYKYGKYCMNHMFSLKQAIVRDLVALKASELVASKMAAGFFPWSSLIKSAKNKHFSQQTLDRLRVANSSVKTTYVEITKTWLQAITGLSVRPVECNEYHKCNPCEAAFFRYPLNLQANTGCMTAMFGGRLACESERSEDEEHPDASSDSPCRAELVSHPYQPLSKCFSNSRVLIAHRADRTLVNRSGKLVAHCVIDYCLPRYMYSSALGTRSLEDCKEHLLASVTSVRGRLKRATAAFNTVMNNCPEHMIPACGTRELERLEAKRQTVARLPSEKLEACLRVITEDMSLRPGDVYRNLTASLGKMLTEAVSEGIVRLREKQSSSFSSSSSSSLFVPGSDASISLSLPSVMLTDAGLDSANGGLSVARSELCERTLVDLAGIVYQTVLMLQVHNPDAFGSAVSMYPETALCIMPYSRADATLMRMWIETFKEKKWLRPHRARLGKRTRSALADCREATYHCAGCRNFYRDLFDNNVPARRLIQHVYGQDKRRKLGRCVDEKRFLS